LWKVDPGSRKPTAVGLWALQAPIASVYGGDNFTFILLTDGTVWATGFNGNGELGTGDATSRSKPTLVASGVASLASGPIRDHSWFLKLDQTLWATGSNSSGQLGIGDTSTGAAFSPIVLGLTGVTRAWLGTEHSVFLMTDGNLYALGNELAGDLGQGTVSGVQDSPAQVLNVSAGTVSQVVAGYYSTFVLKTDGTLWATGYNLYGQLGTGDTTNRSSLVQVASSVGSVAAGAFHTLFIKTDGTLWGMGNNSHGELGTGNLGQESLPVSIMTSVKAIAAGGEHTMILKTDGTLWTVGSNVLNVGGAWGALGTGDTNNQSTPVQIASSVDTISAGAYQSFFRKTDGTWWACGVNQDGELGTGDTSDRLTPVQVGP
jgi:alpha-tubulin suppressor-like RCC1 family protein